MPVWADGGYIDAIDASLLGWAMETLSLMLEIVGRTDDVKGFRVLPRRRVVARTFAGWCATAGWPRDYERLTGCFEAMIKIAMIRLMAARLAGHKATWATTSAHRPHCSITRRAGTVRPSAASVVPLACEDHLRWSASAVPDLCPTPRGPRDRGRERLRQMVVPAGRRGGNGHYVPVAGNPRVHRPVSFASTASLSCSVAPMPNRSLARAGNKTRPGR